MKNILVVGLGEILWDVFPERKILGGAPANFAYHVSQFGINGCAVSAVGKDLLGKEILETLESKKLNYTVEQTDFPTGTVQVTLDSRGVPTYEILENVAWDNIPFSAKIENLAKTTNTVCFGSLAQRSSVSRTSIRKFLEAMPKDSLRIFDINLRQHYYDKGLIHESLTLANVLKINDEEVEVVADLFGMSVTCEETFCKELIKKYDLKILILTKGTQGSFVVTADDISFQPTPLVRVADTVGAGDSFTGAFTAGYLNGFSIPDAHKLAVEVSAYVCTQHGAMPVLPDSYKELFR